MPFGRDRFSGAHNYEEDHIQDLVFRLLASERSSRDNDRRFDSSRYGGGYRGLGDRDLFEPYGMRRENHVRQTNSVAQVANSSITPHMLHAEVHPKLQTDGSFPRGFETPKRVEEFFHVDIGTLDRLLSAYDLPLHAPSEHSLSFADRRRRDGHSSLLALGSSDVASLRNGNTMDVELERRAKLLMGKKDGDVISSLGLGTGTRRGQNGFGEGLSVGFGIDRVKEGKLKTLFEFLGVDVKDEKGLGGSGGLDRQGLRGKFDLETMLVTSGRDWNGF